MDEEGYGWSLWVIWDQGRWAVRGQIQGLLGRRRGWVTGREGRSSCGS